MTQKEKLVTFVSTIVIGFTMYVLYGEYVKHVEQQDLARQKEWNSYQNK